MAASGRRINDFIVWKVTTEEVYINLDVPPLSFRCSQRASRLECSKTSEMYGPYNNVLKRLKCKDRWIKIELYFCFWAIIVTKLAKIIGNSLFFTKSMEKCLKKLEKNAFFQSQKGTNHSFTNTPLDS